MWLNSRLTHQLIELQFKINVPADSIRLKPSAHQLIELHLKHIRSGQLIKQAFYHDPSRRKISRKDNPAYIIVQ